MIALPQWLIDATGAAAFANNPLNGNQPTIGDALQGIGHSMMEHYRRGHQDGAAAGGNSSILSSLPPIEKLALHFNTDGTSAPAGGQQQPQPQVPNLPPLAIPPTAPPPPVTNFTDPNIVSNILAGTPPQVRPPTMPVGQALQMFR